MKYMGSKRRIAKQIASYINNSASILGIKNYYEPFCGGCSVVEEVNIQNRYCSDANNFLIALLKEIQNGAKEISKLGVIPEELWKDCKNNQNTGKYPDWFIGYVGFYGSFRSKWYDSYFSEHLDSKNGRIRNNAESIPSLIEESKRLNGVEFNCSNYKDIVVKSPSVIYCDAPYRYTEQYMIKHFNYEEYYEWLVAMSKNNLVLISEYYMPSDKFEILCEYDMMGAGVGHGLSGDEEYTSKEIVYYVKGGYGTELFSEDTDDYF